MSGTDYPHSHSDIQCGVCFLYFRLDGDLHEHRVTVHAPAAERSGS